ncbi:MAG TPA: hypothetical protein VF266_25365 [Thermoanaerobaculia bacterium]
MRVLPSLPFVFHPQPSALKKSNPHAVCTRHDVMLKEIERDDWGHFFETFTVQHDHWRVHVDGENDTLPLEGITARDGRIVIHLGSDIRHHRVITIDGATVSVEQSGGADESVAITSTDGHTTRLRLERP